MDTHTFRHIMYYTHPHTHIYLTHITTSDKKPGYKNKITEEKERKHNRHQHDTQLLSGVTNSQWRPEGKALTCTLLSLVLGQMAYLYRSPQTLQAALPPGRLRKHAAQEGAEAGLQNGRIQFYFYWTQEARAWFQTSSGDNSCKASLYTARCEDGVWESQLGGN